ncbi:MAG: putative AlkP superfamily pyrophosphatase or phosphodiesterase [Flammeovirgaceae bacterium]|jgi:predicted AlkP superfamily pyrophosphatase or phosphodiesterase
MKRTLGIAVAVFLSMVTLAQGTDNRPKLVVGIVVDQMRNDFLSRYADLYGEGGFKRLMEDGFYGANHRFSYTPTITGPGHASVYTGTTPAVHAIVANDWYDPISKKGMYCVEDKSVKSVGVDKAAGQMSPKNLKTTTVTDELKLFWNQKAKVIAVSLKDRGAVLPGGHLADGAYWYKDKKFITSSYYMDELPEWVNDFNNRNLVDTYFVKGWQPLLATSLYTASLPDNNPYESLYEGEKYPVLPKDLADLAKQNDPEEVLKRSPWGNSLILEFGLAAVIKEELGQDDITDFLALSFSSPDYMGHAYGPRSLEVQDMYLRLDNDLSEFFDFLDSYVGKGQYTIMLTADHGVADVAQYSIDNNLPGGYFDRKGSKELLTDILLEYDSLGLELIEEMEGNHIFFNREKLKEARIAVSDLADYMADEMCRMPGIYGAYPSEKIRLAGSAEFPIRNLQRGLHPYLSGDVIFITESGWMRHGKTGTTHGSPWVYDQHVPLLLYGFGVEKGKTYRETNIRDIAPTLSLIMGVPFPSGMTGSPIIEAIKD